MRGLIQLFFCSCYKQYGIGGPAADSNHHQRDCRAIRIARRLGYRTPEDPSTGWVIIAPRP